MLTSRSLTLILLLSGTSTFAVHLPGGNITYECIGGNEYEVTLTLFRDCDGSELLSQDLLFKSDCGTSFTLTALPVGTGTEVSQLCPADLANSSCNGGGLPGIEVYQVSTTTFLSNCIGWRISWDECCRSSSINLEGNPGTYVEAFVNTMDAPCNNSPIFTQSVIPYVCVNEPVNYNLAVTEEDGHELRYRLITARWQQPPIPVNYVEGNSGAAPYPGLEIDSLTGQITFTPAAIGKIFVVVRVDEFQSAQLVGSVMRDFPFVVIGCPNNAPDPNSGQISALSGNFISADATEISLCTNGDICFSATITDPDDGQSITLVSNITTVLPGATFNITGTSPATANICWDGGDLTPGSYGFVITAEDNACPTTGLTTYAYTLNVLADSVADCLGTLAGTYDDNHPRCLIWPLPANELINISHRSRSPVKMRMYDLEGRLVLDRPLQPGTSTIDISDKAPGSYLVHLLSGDGELFRQIIISP